MKPKFFLIVALLLLPFAAFARQEGEVLLTPDGTLYTIDTEWAADHPEVVTASNNYLVLTARRGDNVERRLVPASLSAGIHTNPSLAYDNDSRTLFIFWQHAETLMESELVFESFGADGEWGSVTAFGNGKNPRYNLRIALTRKAELEGDDGAISTASELNLHAVWWEWDYNSTSASARYAMLTVENGAVSNISLHSLEEFVAPHSTTYPVDPEMNAEILKFPAVSTTAMQDSVDVVFGNLAENGFHTVRIRPRFKLQGDARIHIPIGVRENAFPAPEFRTATDNVRIGGFTGTEGNVAFYFDGKSSLNYLMFKHGQWTDTRSIAIDEAVTRDTALDAVRRLVNDTE
ncbi:MAG TPA: hypothetical protein VFN10_21645 [Thermoanaerobaculia bacterium]|nr:hypothetical protein [Thermoanaerobaculia bacterium]